ncbi:MAG: hypothetical protein JWP04_2987 [Belnapia sp.]|nr:hypothetical protein [Belnapia sp.]
MLMEIRLNASVLQALGDLGQKLARRLYRSSGWSIPDDTDTGISFGEAVDGGGYMEMDVKDLRLPDGKTYEIRGGYLELGIGLGEISKLQGPVNAIVKMMPKGARPSSDIVVMPGGSIGPFIMGPLQDKAQLTLEDFRYSSWIYVHIGAEVLVLSGDIGLMFLVDHKFTVDLLLGLATANVTTVVTSMLTNCQAWAPYYGTALGLGAGGKVAVRVIQTVHMK